MLASGLPRATEPSRATISPQSPCSLIPAIDLLIQEKKGKIDFQDGRHFSSEGQMTQNLSGNQVSDTWPSWPSCNYLFGVVHNAEHLPVLWYSGYSVLSNSIL